jgi:hypothetical protein
MSFEEYLKEHFSKGSRNCKHHVQIKSQEGHRCICNLIEGTCNKFDCPRVSGRSRRDSDEY